jgi:hypothetical protein
LFFAIGRTILFVTGKKPNMKKLLKLVAISSMATTTIIASCGIAFAQDAGARGGAAAINSGTGVSGGAMGGTAPPFSLPSITVSDPTPPRSAINNNPAIATPADQSQYSGDITAAQQAQITSAAIDPAALASVVRELSQSNPQAAATIAALATKANPAAAEQITQAVTGAVPDAFVVVGMVVVKNAPNSAAAITEILSKQKPASAAYIAASLTKSTNANPAQAAAIAAAATRAAPTQALNITSAVVKVNPSSASAVASSVAVTAQGTNTGNVVTTPTAIALAASKAIGSISPDTTIFQAVATATNTPAATLNSDLEISKATDSVNRATSATSQVSSNVDSYSGSANNADSFEAPQAEANNNDAQSNNPPVGTVTEDDNVDNTSADQDDASPNQPNQF